MSIENEKRFRSLRDRALPGIMVVCDLRQLRGRVKKVKQFEIHFRISTLIENLLHESLQMCWCRLMILNIYKRFRPRSGPTQRRS